MLVFSILVEALRGGLIVSCQALPNEPLFGAQHMTVMADAARVGGAVAIRANGPGDVAAIRKAVELPIIGLFKDDVPNCDVHITPTLGHVDQIALAGADIIALDATSRARPNGLTVKQLIEHSHQAHDKAVLADISTLEEGVEAAKWGADFVATTLSGYTDYSLKQVEPDFLLLEQLVARLRPLQIPVIAEGRICTPDQAVQALQLGAHAVVVGSAITRPQWITARFAEALKKVNEM